MAPRGSSTFGRPTAKEKSLDAQLQHDIAQRTADESLKPSRKRFYGEGVTPPQEDLDAVQADASDGNGETNNSTVPERQVKRSRSSEWPLPVPDQLPVQSVSNTLRRSKVPTGSPSSQRRRHVSNRLQEPRSSAFLEGSMNDRVSKVPPVDFTSEDYSRSQSDLLAGQSKEHYDAGIADNKRQTNIFRFGRSIAAAVSSVFNFRKESSSYTQDGMDEDDRDPKSQKLKAEKVYKELKDQGKLRGLATMPPTKVGVTHKAGSQSTASLLPTNCKRDSGVDVGELRYSEDGKRGKHSFADDAALLIPPSTFGTGSKEPESDASSPRKSAFSFRRPSLVNLKKAKSVANLSAAEDKQGSLGPESALSDATEQSATRNTLKKKPSKKDLQKEQKLRKRVSDLEVKVESARRELAKFRGEDLPPVPCLPAHVTGKLEGFQRTQLYSLPSERLLKLPAHELAQHSDSHDAQASDAYFTSAESPTKATFRGDFDTELTYESLAVDKAVVNTVEDSQELKEDPRVSQISLQRPQELPKLTEEPDTQEQIAGKALSKVAPIRKMLPKKRKSNDEDGVFKPEPESEEDDKEDEEGEGPVRRTRTSRRGRKGSYGIFPKKSQKFATGDSPGSSGTRRRKSGTDLKKENIKPSPTTPPRRAWRPPGQAEKVHSPHPSGNLTVCSPGSSKGNPIEVSGDDALLNKEKKQPADPRSSNRNSKGKDMSSLSELGHNQGTSAQAVIISRVATPARRVSHQRSRSVSPAKPGLAQSLSPPPSLSFSKPTTARSSVEDDVVSVVPDTGTVPAMPSLPLEFVSAGKQKSSEARLTKAVGSTSKKGKVEAGAGGSGTGLGGEPPKMEAQREEYEWPEDVF